MTITRSRSPDDLAAAPAAKGPEVFVVSPERLLALQFAAITTLIVLHVTTKAFHVLGGHDQLFGFGPLLDMDEEANVPAYYSMLIVLADAALLALTGAAYRRHRLAGAWYWFFLAAVFVLLAYDEAFSVHERIGMAIRRTFRNEHSQHFQWVVPGLAFATAVAAVLARFLFRLDPHTRWLMIVSGAIFVAGAVGFELLGGLRYERVQPTLAKPDALYFALVTAEETLEMLGMALFSYALLNHFRATFGRLTVHLGR